LSDDFGRHGIAVEARFAGGSWTRLATGAPVLTDAAANLDCRIARVAEVGTHSVLFCEVEEIATALQPEGLIYFNRLYHRIGSPVQPIDEAYA
jgi:flavin reductase